MIVPEHQPELEPEPQKLSPNLCSHQEHWGPEVAAHEEQLVYDRQVRAALQLLELPLMIAPEHQRELESKRQLLKELSHQEQPEVAAHEEQLVCSSQIWEHCE